MRMVDKLRAAMPGILLEMRIEGWPRYMREQVGRLEIPSSTDIVWYLVLDLVLGFVPEFTREGLFRELSEERRGHGKSGNTRIRRASGNPGGA